MLSTLYIKLLISNQSSLSSMSFKSLMSLRKHANKTHH